GEDDIARVGDQGPGDFAQARDRTYVTVFPGVDHVDGVVGGVGDVEPGGGRVHGRVVEPAFARVRRQIDVPLGFEAHPGACSSFAFPSTFSWQYAYSAS